MRTTLWTGGKGLDKVKRIDRKLVKKCNVFDLYEDTILTPEGHTAKWDYLKHDGAACIIPVLPDGRILMVRQFRNAIDRESLEVPAGKKDGPEEDPYLCASRELEEETGYRSEHLEKLMKLVTAIAYCSETIDVYIARDLIPTAQRLDEDEFIDVIPYDLETLLDMIFCEEIQDAKTVASLMAYKVYMENRNKESAE